MTQIFILGSSSVYGVGAEQAGWADLIKQKFHHHMYGPNGVGEMFEVYNFSKSGATVEFVQASFPQLRTLYGRSGSMISIVSVGGNNAKAVGTPDNYVSTVEEYIQQMSTLLDQLQVESDHIIAVGGGYYDESKTNPKLSPWGGRPSFFTNSRKKNLRKRCRYCASLKQYLLFQSSCLKKNGKHNV